MTLCARAGAIQFYSEGARNANMTLMYELLGDKAKVGVSVGFGVEASSARVYFHKYGEAETTVENVVCSVVARTPVAFVGAEDTPVHTCLLLLLLLTS